MTITGNGNTIFLLPERTGEILSLTNGTYTASINILNETGVSGPSRMDLKWYNYGAAPTNWQIGGLRIAKQINYNGQNNNVITTYNYKLNDDSGLSSGAHFQNFRFSYEEFGNDANPN